MHRFIPLSFFVLSCLFTISVAMVWGDLLMVAPWMREYIYDPRGASIILTALLGTLYIYIVLVLGPVYDLRDEIASFLAGKRRSDDDDVSQFSPEVTFITTFFRRALDILERYK